MSWYPPVAEGPMDHVEVASLGGSCPVQAEGTICGEPFYFRSRGRTWRCEVGNPPTLTAWGWYGEPADEFGAGCIPEDEALARIAWTGATFASGARGEAQHAPDPLKDALRMACELRGLELMFSNPSAAAAFLSRWREALGRHVETLSSADLARFEAERPKHLKELEDAHAAHAAEMADGRAQGAPWDVLS